MNGRGGAAATDFVATMLHPEAEYNCGLTLTSFAAMFTRLIMERYGVTMEDPVSYTHLVQVLSAERM